MAAQVGNTVAYAYAERFAYRSNCMFSGPTHTLVESVSSVTVTVQQSAFPLPSVAVAVITAVPAALAVTTPLSASTVATLVLLELQHIDLSVAFSGHTVARRVKHVSGFSVREEMFRQTEETGIEFLTVTVQQSFLPLPSFAVAVIEAVPMLLAIIRPLSGFTVATLVLLELQHTDRLAALRGQTVASNVKLVPGVTIREEKFRRTDSTRVSLLTVMVQQSLLPLPSFAVAMTTAVPGFIALTKPLSGFTVATLVSLELQHTDRLAALTGHTVASNVKLVPGETVREVKSRHTESTKMGFFTTTVQ